MTPHMPTSGIAPWAWAALSVVGWAVSFLAAFGVLAGLGTIGIQIPNIGGLRIELAVLLALFGTFAAAGVLGSARLIYTRWPAVQAMAAIMPLAGLTLAAAVELGLHAWVTARFTYYDWDMVGWTAGLSLMLVTLAVATFATLIAPRDSAQPPVIAQVVAAAVIGLIVLSNVEGITDGIEPGSWPLAVLVGLSAAYAVAAVLIGVRRMARR
jgi:hypothetical protein